MKTIYGGKPKTESETRCAAVSESTLRTCRCFATTPNGLTTHLRAGVAENGSQSLHCSKRRRVCARDGINRSPEQRTIGLKNRI